MANLPIACLIIDLFILVRLYELCYAVAIVLLSNLWLADACSDQARCLDRLQLDEGQPAQADTTRSRSKLQRVHREAGLCQAGQAAD